MCKVHILLRSYSQSIPVSSHKASHCTAGARPNARLPDTRVRPIPSLAAAMPVVDVHKLMGAICREVENVLLGDLLEVEANPLSTGTSYTKKNANSCPTGNQEVALLI